MSIDCGPAREPQELDPRITFSALRQLAALETQGSLGSVARNLGVSQPTVSANLLRLEKTLGFSLVARTTQGSMLTQEGSAAASAARLVIEATQTFAATVEGLSGLNRENLRIAASQTTAEQLVPRWLADPEIAGMISPGRATLLVGNSQQVMSWLAAESADIGFIEGNNVRDGLTHTSLGHDKLVAIVGPSHRWFTQRPVISPADLIRSGLVVRERGSGTLEVLQHALARAGLTLPTQVPSFGSTSAILTAVKHGGAVAVVSQLAVQGEIDEGRLAVIDVQRMNLVRQIRAVWLDGTPPRADGAMLISNVAKHWKTSAMHSE